MKKLLLLSTIIFFCFSVTAQDFFSENFNHRKKYIILANPTVRNLKTISYLVNADLLDINTRKTKFVGVYYTGQNYDFNLTRDYIDKNDLKNFYLHEVKADLNENNLFEENGCTKDLKTIFENSIGVFFFGGPDIPPAVYNEENTLSVVTDPGRHYFETTFLFHLLGSYRNNSFNAFLINKPRYLVTGFCLGMQTMNVATGGNLIQDIPAEVYGAETPESTLKSGRTNLHRNYWQNVVKDSLLMGINLHTIQFTGHPFFGDNIKVNKRLTPRIYSSHHQAVEKLGKGMEVTALSPDGEIIEGLAHKRFPNVFAVQFHPEVSALYENMYVRKFHPEDTPMSYNDIIGKKSVKFHEKYWGHISQILRKAKRK
ncbi:MAG: C26 family cysteine hydrolase domain-containing family [Prolixibacteraceae bacterium]|jgi:putative glutamine amidotransferase|nr:C26 family cysteine hydrolase domain-containing family [Prolixibacteraceae bacterium]MBT6007224.1 C26 family cysteine hydrolase domain-containing family [Prolixibacteraceae bacterium]MBT6766200.1 C26 family cysteine hydrolase domain-containing family [Prolixibacteraceae bacterium]MBT6999320.1 C26 family cysteine hydrolase domain-containing family [Prolixibacteraceae bacterium]MBT7395454.1 C26 family cysteine hydrolase domain-containing family [Prolixibacteraceae bacterium]